MKTSKTILLFLIVLILNIGNLFAQSCSSCSTANCSVSSITETTVTVGQTNISTALAVAGDQLGLPSLSPGESVTVCVPVTVPVGSTVLGFKQRAASTPGGCGSPSEEVITYELLPASNCSATPITPDVLNASGVASGFNPEWNNLTSGNYILCYTLTVVNSAICFDVDLQGLGYYNVIPTATSSCNTCTNASCPVISITEATVTAGQTNISTALAAAGDQLGLPSLSPGGNVTVCVPVTVPVGSTVMGFKQRASSTPGGCGDPSEEVITYELLPASNCSTSPIVPDVLNASGVSSGFNPEWNNLTPGNYVLCYTLSVINAALCFDVDVQGLGYYNIIPPTVSCQDYQIQMYTDLSLSNNTNQTSFSCSDDVVFLGPNNFSPTFNAGIPYPAVNITVTANTGNLNNLNILRYDAGTNGLAETLALPFGGSINNFLLRPAPGQYYTLDKTNAQSGNYNYTITDVISGMVLDSGNWVIVGGNPSGQSANIIPSGTGVYSGAGVSNGLLPNLPIEDYSNDQGMGYFDPATAGPGNHTITYTWDNQLTGANNCSLVRSINVTVTGIITPIISTTAPSCIADGSSTVTNYDNSLTYNFTPAGPSVGAGGAISGMTLGTAYTVVSDNGSCTSAASASFTNVAMLVTPAVPTITTIPPSCVADASSSVTNYSAALTYVFTPAGPTVGVGGAIIGMTVGTAYTVTADNGSCTSAASASFTNLPMLTTLSPTYTSTVSNCNSGTIAINNILPVGTTLEWVNGPTGYVFPTGFETPLITNTNLTGLPAGTYCVDITSPVNSGSPIINTLLTEDFESGATNWTIDNSGGNNEFIINNVYGGGTCTLGGFPFTVPNVPNQGAWATGGNQSNYLHIMATTTCGFSCAEGGAFPPANANYCSTTSNQSITLNTPLNTLGSTNVTFDFYYLNNPTDTDDYGALEYSIDGGTNWIQSGANLFGQATWFNESITDPGWDNQPSLLFRIIWTNDSGSSSDPPLSLDQITITALQPGGNSCSEIVQECFTIEALPIIPTINTVAPTCAADGNSTVTNYNAAITYTFTPAGPTLGSGGAISGMTLGTAYTVIADNGSCTSVASASFTNVAMLVSPEITSFTNNTDICAMADAVFTLEGTADTDVSYSYTIGAGAAVAGTVTLDNTGNGTVTIPTAQNTTSSIDVVLTLIDITNPVTTCSIALTNVSTVTVNPNPEITNLTNNTDICAMVDAVFTLEGTADTDVSYSYTIGAGAAVAGTVTLDNAGNGTVTIATPQNTTTAIDVVITLIDITNPVTTCSTTLTNTSTVTVNPNPEITNFTNNTDICAMADAVFTLVGTADTDVSYSYTVGAGASVAGTVTLDNTGNGTVTIPTVQNTTTAIDVVLTLNNIFNPLTTCSTALTNVSTVTVNPNPEVTNVTNNSDICAMEDAIFDITGTADTVVTYTIDGGAAQTITLDGTGAGQIVVTTVQNTTAAVNIVLTLSDITNPVTGCNTALTNVSTIIVNPNPEAISVDMAPVCDDDLDGQMIFDLTTNINALTNNASGVTVTFYNSQADAEGLLNSFTAQGLDTSAYQIQAPAVLPTVQNVETIWVNIQNDTTGCDSVTSFTITVNTVMANGPVDLYACEQDNDGFAQFNLYDAVAFIGGNIPSMQVYFYATPGQAAAQIAGTEIGSGNSATVTDIFHSVVNTYDEPIYVVVVDTATGCSYNAEGIVMLNVIDAPELQTGAIDYTLCDYDGDETDNIAVFDLTSLNSQLFIDANTDLADYTVTYYSSLISEGGAADVLISNDTAYENVSDPQVIYAVVTANTVYGCSTIKEVTLLVDLPPVAEAFYSLTICDDDYYLGATDIPSHSFDLTSSESFITNETGNIFSYYLTNADASAATNAITNTTDFENTVNPQDIYVRIENPTTGCFTVTLLELQVLPNPSPLTPDEIDAQMGVMQSCVNDGNGEGTLQEGYAIFNLLDYETAILIGQGPQVEPGVTLTYYISESDANLGLNPIADPSNFYNTEEFGQIIWVRAENDETGCYTLTDFDIQVPAIIIDAVAINTDTLCVDEYGVPLTDMELPILSASATNLIGSTSDGIYNYQWSLNGVDIPGATDQTLTVSQAGDYMVTVTGSEQMDFSCINTATVSITASSSPDDYQASVTTNAFANAHQVVATATSSLAGVEFIYTLDTGEENTTGIFNDVTPGPHTITISDAGGCWFDVLDLFVIDYPKFFSPNGDGANDTWMIYGIDGIPISQIYVFDRFGKLLKQLDPDGPGWNGTYNGYDLPSTDYWFKIIYIENNEQKEFRAHFSLKR